MKDPRLRVRKPVFARACPQLLNRIRWWLDDSADFQKHEDARLKKLGFDTERAEMAGTA